MCTGTPGRVVRIAGGHAEIDVEGRIVAVSLAVLEEPAAVGDWLLAHSGVALARLSEQDARMLRLVRGEHP